MMAVAVMMLFGPVASGQRAATSMASSTATTSANANASRRRGGGGRRSHKDQEDDDFDDLWIRVDDDGHVLSPQGMEPIDLAFSGIKLEMSTKPKKKRNSIAKEDEESTTTASSNNNNGKKRLLLDGSIHGQAKPGRMLAVMGPSGAGKVKKKDSPI